MAKEDPPILVVLESFGTEVGGIPINYVKGETIDADHPAVKRWPQFFGPLVVLHRTPSRARMPEVRAAVANPEVRAG